MKVYADQGVDQRKLRALQKRYDFRIVQGQSLEQNIKIAESIPNVFVLNESLLNGGDYLAGSDISDVEVEVGKKNGLDIAHIYSAYHAGCAYFITNNPGDFIYDSGKYKTEGKRQRLEAILKDMKIVTIEEFAGSLRRQQ